MSQSDLEPGWNLPIWRIFLSPNLGVVRGVGSPLQKKKKKRVKQRLLLGGGTHVGGQEAPTIASLVLSLLWAPTKASGSFLCTVGSLLPFFRHPGPGTAVPTVPWPCGWAVWRL